MPDQKGGFYHAPDLGAPLSEHEKLVLDEFSQKEGALEVKKAIWLGRVLRLSPETILKSMTSINEECNKHLYKI